MVFCHMPYWQKANVYKLSSSPDREMIGPSGANDAGCTSITRVFCIATDPSVSCITVSRNCLHQSTKLMGTLDRYGVGPIT